MVSARRLASARMAPPCVNRGACRFRPSLRVRKLRPGSGPVPGAVRSLAAPDRHFALIPPGAGWIAAPAGLQVALDGDALVRGAPSARLRLANGRSASSRSLRLAAAPPWLMGRVLLPKARAASCGGPFLHSVRRSFSMRARRVGFPGHVPVRAVPAPARAGPRPLQGGDPARLGRSSPLCLITSDLRIGTAVGILDQSGTGGEPHVQPGAEEARDRDLHQIRP